MKGTGPGSAFFVEGKTRYLYNKQKPMDTPKNIMTDILKTTMQIQEQFPELTKYIPEVPVTIPDNDSPEITSENLTGYNDSLKSLLAKYAGQQGKVKKQVSQKEADQNLLKE